MGEPVFMVDRVRSQPTPDNRRKQTMRTIEQRAEGDRGFTLIELLVVIIVIGILAGVAIPVMLNNMHKAHDASARSDLRNIAIFEEGYATDNPASYASAPELASTMQRLPVSPEDSVWMFRAGAQGYCLVGHNTGSTAYLVYDSEAGGLQQTAYASLPLASQVCSDAGYTPAGSIVNDSSGTHVS
jgi:type IV pilus assembly protein PilA